MNARTRNKCPFCGSASTAVFLDTLHMLTMQYSVKCRGCGAQGPVRPTSDGAEAAWNERIAADDDT